MSILNRENILSFFLGVVVVYFGFSEVSAPLKWVGMVPEFFGEGEMIRYLVMIHGAILLVSGFALFFNFKRRAAAAIIAIMLLSIVVNFFQTGGVNPTMMRDVGLLGLALGLAVRN